MARRNHGFSAFLTEHWEGQLIAVIVSGYDGDGAAALSGIKEVGGITIAQKLATAEQPDMPESAIKSGCIDFILSPEDIAEAISRIAHADTKPPAARSTWAMAYSTLKPSKTNRALRVGGWIAAGVGGVGVIGWLTTIHPILGGLFAMLSLLFLMGGIVWLIEAE